MKIERTTIVAALFDKSPEAIAVFDKLGYKCHTCVVQEKDTLELAAKLHKKDVDALIRALKKVV